jgi:membrane protein DedA with SNARE-associated domain
VAAAASFFAEYGLAMLFATVLVGSLGAPLPLLPLFLLVGARSASDPLYGLFAFGLAIAAAMLADLAWYVAGRRFGVDALGFASRVLRSPERVRHAEALFARRGPAILLIARFIPGLSLIASPLAGVLGMRHSSFAVFNAAGVMLWAGTSILSGMLLREEIELGMARIADIGSYAVSVGVATLLCGVLYSVGNRLRAARAKRVVGRPFGPRSILQSPEIDVDQRLGRSRERETPLVEYPVRQQPLDESAQPDRRGSRINRVAEQTSCDRVTQGLLDPPRALPLTCAMAFPQPRRIADVFAFVIRNIKSTLQSRIARGALQRFERTAAQLGERVRHTFIGRAIQHCLDRKHDALHHRVEEIDLVPEVPVHSAARDSGGGCDARERSARHTVLVEYALGRIEDTVSSLECLFSGASRHGWLGQSRRPSCRSANFTYIHACM